MKGCERVHKRVLVRIRSKWGVFLIIFLLSIVGFLVSGYFRGNDPSGTTGTDQNSKTTEAENWVARVNGISISDEQWRERVANLREFAKAQGMDLDSETHRDIARQIESDSLEQLIQEQLLIQAAAKEGIVVNEADVKRQINLMRDQVGKEAFAEMLKASNLTEEKIASELRYQMLGDSLYRKVTEGVKVDPSEVEDYYNNHKEDLTQVKIRYILLGTASGSPESAHAKSPQELAQEVFPRLEKGESFAGLAKEYSQDTSTREAGGLMDMYLTKDSPVLPVEVIEASRKLEKGQYTREAVQTAQGWYLVELEDKRESLADLKSGIEQALLAEKMNIAFNDYYIKLEQEGKIERMKADP